MFDPLGLNKDLTREPGHPAGDEPAAGHGSPRLWQALLGLDMVLVVVFGGTLAARIYQHWSAPAPASASARRNPKAKEPERKPAPAPAAPTSKPVEPAKETKTPEPPKAPAPKPTPAAAAPAPHGPVPKPSLVQGSAPAHATTGPLGKAAEKPARAAPVSEASGAKTKAVPVEFKLHSPKAKTVELSGAFLVHARNGRKSMSQGDGGDWAITIYLKPGTYRYNFFVNGKKKLDPDNAKSERGASVILVTGQ